MAPALALSPEAAIASQNPFALQDAAQACAKTPLAPLCRGYLAAALNQLPDAESQLSAWLKAPSQANLVPQTQVKLASVLILQGKFAPAVALYKKLLELPLSASGRQGLENAIGVFGSLQGVPPMQIKPQAEKLPLSWDVHGSPNLALQADNGQAVQALLDTGANLSTVSRSAATKLGLEPIPGQVQTVDSMGQTVQAQLALARHLRLGRTELRNVPFLLLEDKSLRFQDYQIQLILGLPVLLQLGRLELYRRGECWLGGPSPAGSANLFLDQFNLAVRADLGGKPIDLMVDTGARRSHLVNGFEATAGQAWPGFKPERAKDTGGGVGGMMTVDAIRLHGLSLNLAASALDWSEIFVYSETLAQGRLIGVIGEDALRQPGQGFALDFRSMRLDWLSR